jgi:hypothetical protein
MAEPTCLHVQDRESGPIRVVEIPWVSVRIGQAAHCEVQLTEHDVDDVVCRLYRRSGTWHLLPAETRQPILLDGKPVTELCPLPFDVPFRFGRYCLTLRRDRAAAPDWGMYTETAPAPAAQAADQPDAAHSAARQQQGPAADARAIVPVSATAEIKRLPSAMEREQSLRTGGGPDGWETRWRAFGAELLARSARAPLNTESKPVIDHAPHAAHVPFGAVPLKEPRVPPVSPPTENPPPGPTLSRPAARIEPEWIGRKVEPQPAVPLTPPARRAPKVERDWTASKAEPPEPHARAAPAWKEWIAPEPAIESPCCRLREVHPEIYRSRPAPSDPPAVTEPPSLTRAWQPPLAAEIPPAADGATEERPAAPVSGTPRKQDLELSRPAPKRGRRRPAEAHDRSVTRRRRNEHAAPLPNRRESDGAPSRLEWPSAKDILAMHRAIPPPRAEETKAPNTSGAAPRPAALPTMAREPGHWDLPVWLAGPPLAIFVLAVGLAGCVLSCLWAGDTYNASVVTDRLMSADRSALSRPLPESVGPPEGNWMSSTAGHLARWAIFLTRYDAGVRPQPEEITALLERALEASPLNREARLAVAQLEPPPYTGAVSLRSLGLSRDAVSLGFSARRLRAAGKKQAALAMYGHALEVAIPAATLRTGVPRFSDDPGAPRYLLPGEERVREIVRELLAGGEWPFNEWSAIIPRSAIASLAAARLLRERGGAEAATLLDAMLQEPQTSAATGRADALTLAARAEACALVSRWREAGELYRQAIESVDDETVKRSWWFNLADIAFRLDDERQRQAALRAAVAVSDDITRRAVDIQRATRARPLARSIGVRAN